MKFIVNNEHSAFLSNIIEKDISLKSFQSVEKTASFFTDPHFRAFSAKKKKKASKFSLDDFGDGGNNENDAMPELSREHFDIPKSSHLFDVVLAEINEMCLFLKKMALSMMQVFVFQIIIIF